MKIPKKDNQVLLSLIEDLVKTKKPFWRKIASELSRPRRRRAEVNLTKIEEYAPEESTVVVPGKVLGAGSMSKKVTVAAFSFSESAKKLISAAGGKAVSIDSLHKTNPEGRGVIILK
jgi:large subunit ribosomal protein L18e